MKKKLKNSLLIAFALVAVFALFYLRVRLVGVKKGTDWFRFLSDGCLIVGTLYCGVFLMRKLARSGVLDGALYIAVKSVKSFSLKKENRSFAEFKKDLSNKHSCGGNRLVMGLGIFLFSFAVFFCALACVA